MRKSDGIERTKFTTKIDTELLESLKIYAIQHHTCVNVILENLAKEYLNLN